MREKLVSTVVYLDRELVQWLDAKALEGYRKSALIRRILSIWKDGELAAEAYRDGVGKCEEDGQDRHEEGRARPEPLQRPKVLGEPGYAKDCADGVVG